MKSQQKFKIHWKTKSSQKKSKLHLKLQKSLKIVNLCMFRNCGKNRKLISYPQKTCKLFNFRAISNLCNLSIAFDLSIMFLQHPVVGHFRRKPTWFILLFCVNTRWPLTVSIHRHLKARVYIPVSSVSLNVGQPFYRRDFFPYATARYFAWISFMLGFWNMRKKSWQIWIVVVHQESLEIGNFRPWVGQKEPNWAILMLKLGLKFLGMKIQIRGVCGHKSWILRRW